MKRRRRRVKRKGGKLAPEGVTGAVVWEVDCVVCAGGVTGEVK